MVLHTTMVRRYEGGAIHLEVYELRDLLCFVLFCCDMEEHFILRVSQMVAERLKRILNEDPDAAADGSLDLAFQGQHLN